MTKVKYWCSVDVCDEEIQFETKEEAMVWISETMQEWFDHLCYLYEDAESPLMREVTWLNMFLDWGNITEIYVPDTDVVISCELITE